MQETDTPSGSPREFTVDNFVSFVETKRFVTFINLMDAFDNTQGDSALTSTHNPNVIYWSGMNQAAFDVIIDARRRGLVKMEPTSQLTYLVDGGMLKLPIVKTARVRKTPGWLPVIFNPGGGQ